MKKIAITLASFLAGFVCSGANADVLTRANDNQKIYGIVLTTQDKATTFAVFNAATQRFVKRNFSTDSIQSLVVTVNQTSLAHLDFRDLESVRDTAEQLASIKKDPVCQHIATRLLLLLIHHASETDQTDTSIVQSACRNLTNLVNESNWQLIRKIVWIYGGLKFDPKTILPKTQIDNEAFLKLLHHLRQEEFREAASLLPQIKDGLRLAPETYQRLQQCVTNETVDDSTLAWLLQSEQNFLGFDESEGSSNGIGAMFRYANKKTNAFIGKLTLEQLVEFDVNATRFSQGNWVPPESKK